MSLRSQVAFDRKRDIRNEVAVNTVPFLHSSWGQNT